MKPYSEEKNGNIVRRTFSNNVSENELIWHRDHEDRIVKIVSETDWLFQFDNELPKKLNVNEEIKIPKNTYHRVIKGSGELVVEITETNFELDEKTNPCWKNYKMVGMKEMGGKEVPNCVPIKEKLQNIEKNTIFAENTKRMILHRLHEVEGLVTLGPETLPDSPVKEPVVLPETNPSKPSPRRKRIWEAKPAHKPKPKM